jgi:hypothetical protein
LATTIFPANFRGVDKVLFWNFTMKSTLISDVQLEGAFDRLEYYLALTV